MSDEPFNFSIYFVGYITFTFKHCLDEKEDVSFKHVSVNHVLVED